MLNGLMHNLLAQGAGKTFWMPPQASTTAHETDWVWYFIYWVSVFFFVLIVAAAVYFVVRYRQKDPTEQVTGPTHNMPLEITWSVIPLILVGLMFWWGFTAYLDIKTPPENAMNIDVLAAQWSWEFKYPGGNTDKDLHVPVDTPVVLTMTSQDVIHSLYIPAFRKKMDVVPGRYQKLWFQATQPGTYPLLCTEYCGTSHSDMLANVVVEELGQYEKYLENLDPLKRLTPEQYQEYIANPDKFVSANPDLGLVKPADMGKRLWDRKGCKQCHSLDGTALVGPSWKGIWGHMTEFENAPPQKVDEDYIRESILNPKAKIVKGYPGQMPTYQGRLTDRDIQAIIDFIKTLSE